MLTYPMDKKLRSECYDCFAVRELMPSEKDWTLNTAWVSKKPDSGQIDKWRYLHICTYNSAGKNHVYEALVKAIQQSPSLLSVYGNIGSIPGLAVAALKNPNVIDMTVNIWGEDVINELVRRLSTLVSLTIKAGIVAEMRTVREAIISSPTLRTVVWTDVTMWNAAAVAEVMSKAQVEYCVVVYVHEEAMKVVADAACKNRAVITMITAPEYTTPRAPRSDYRAQDPNFLIHLIEEPGFYTHVWGNSQNKFILYSTPFFLADRVLGKIREVSPAAIEFAAALEGSVKGIPLPFAHPTAVVLAATTFVTQHPTEWWCCAILIGELKNSCRLYGSLMHMLGCAVFASEVESDPLYIDWDPQKVSREEVVSTFRYLAKWHHRDGKIRGNHPKFNSPTAKVRPIGSEKGVFRHPPGNESESMELIIEAVSINDEKWCRYAGIYACGAVSRMRRHNI